MTDSFIQLKCSCNNYPWGKKGHESLAAKYCAQTPGTDFRIEDNVEYAEMWMGTYPTTPSFVLSSGEKLQDVLNANKEKLIGRKVLSKYGSDLPFLPKILSIAKALPLQLHPNKDIASELHKKDSDKFADANHKPEIAVALSDFELFVGFKPLEEIHSLFEFGFLQRFLPSGEKGSKFDDETLQFICGALLRARGDVVREVVQEFQTQPKEKLGQHAYLLDLFPRIQDQYTVEDNGILVALFCMNYMKLKAGEAVYVPQDSIHAYLSGDIIECMARSDNVLNTGFCPQADRDSLDVFLKALTFEPHNANKAILPSKDSDKGSGKTVVYAPPAEEFNVLATALTDGEEETIKEIHGPSIMVVTKGSGSMNTPSHNLNLKEGYVFFVGQGVESRLKADPKGELVVYRAYCE
ncbi:phosphomannose isomerase type I [Lepidopterella palustris CBS 459.81]|uniref:Mannose-6-phosphate isomerase n=1 Tax=Lepidopterella palustris CBS 459.81 TaxID=1314670 RepID=A0A8E2DX71_9PEZI|nr:phosphomannose isomerase type I [Lepidopterella palustris CBS 459.81]